MIKFLIKTQLLLSSLIFVLQASASSIPWYKKIDMDLLNKFQAGSYEKDKSKILAIVLLKL